ncbi:MAG TPA: LytR C-terminal domain-containing protein [Gaiellaceae bacterium]
MEHAAQPVSAPFPWRAAAVLTGAVALVELVALIAIGLVHVAKHTATVAEPHRPAAAAVKTTHAAVPPAPKIQAVPLRPRSHVRVLVLNGNGVGGAAAAEAAQLRAHGYRIGGATNAARHDYAQSMVMFVPGWSKEARRLARDADVRMVAPLDGLRPAQLAGSKVILLLGR